MKIAYSAFAKVLLFGLGVPGSIAQSATPDLSNSFNASVEFEQRVFFNSSPRPADSGGQFSVKLQAEWFQEWDDGDQRLIFEPFARIDSVDEARSHSDIRQLMYTRYQGNWELAIGLGQVFWGVTETQHLVDIINQTDLVENIDAEDKFGQPMLKLSYSGDRGLVEAYALPYFRERSFPGIEGRLRGGLVVSSNAEYESDNDERHWDWAIRYQHTLGDLSLGLSWFDGTSREPDLIRLLDFERGSTTPFYPQIRQIGGDFQFTRAGWLIKIEAIRRSFDDPQYQDFFAATSGAEYTLVGLFGSAYDLGLLAEYSWDERGESASSIFQDDLFVGARLAFNDVYDSQLLIGLGQDLDFSGSQSLFLEASTRIAAAATLNLELRLFEGDDQGDPQTRFDNDSFIQIGLEFFFN